MISCHAMRVAVATSSLLLVAGVMLLLGSEMTGFIVSAAHLALLTVLAGAAVLAVAFVLALLPAGTRWLEKCQH